MEKPGWGNDFLRFALLYGLLFAGFGVVSPFLGAFLASRDLSPEAIGLVLAGGTAIRLVAGPFFGSLADRLSALRTVLTACTAAACLSGACFLWAWGVWPLLLVNVMQSAAIAPVTAIADALVVTTARGRFDYGWVRGVGSGAFILGTLGAGQAIGAAGLGVVIWLNVACLAIAVPACQSVPQPAEDPLSGQAPQLRQPPQLPRTAPRSVSAARSPGPVALLRLPSFARMMVVAALIQGSHAMHDGFAVIQWRRIGIGDGTISVLWSESVAAEVVVFLLAGPWLINRLGPAGASVLAAVGGIVRWGTLASSGSVAAIALVEPLHGLTFALQHLACIRLIGAVVPSGLAATAQAFYGTLVMGATTTAMTLGSGVLYARIGSGAFWIMAALCAIAIPVACGLRRIG